LSRTGISERQVACFQRNNFRNVLRIHAVSQKEAAEVDASPPVPLKQLAKCLLISGTSEPNKLLIGS
jgi:hypothetical protein